MRLTGDAPTILFSIETMARELDSKLVMAAALASRGLRSIVAHKEAAWAISRASERIIWQGKNLFADNSDIHPADRLAANNSPIMFIQDEGGIFQADGWVHSVLQKHHVDHVRKRKIDRVLMWGRRQKDVFCERAAELANSVVVTGSPRFDMCLPSHDWITAKESSGIRSRLGPYILACTRFTAIAHAEGIHDPFRRKLNPRIWPDNYDMRRVTDVWFSKWQRDVHDFADFVLLIKAIAGAHPTRLVVVRPHPSENLGFYQQAFAAIANITVIREGSALGWIRAADLVVHSNCTTGIEAVLAGRPVVNFLPASSDRGDTDIEVAREAGAIAVSQEDALNKVDRLLAGDAMDHVWSTEARGMLNNLDSEAVPLLVAETLAVVRERGTDSSSVTIPGERWARNAVKRLLRRPLMTPYTVAKRPPLDPHHVERVIAGCHANGIGTGQIRHLTKSYAVIEPA